MDKYLNLKYMEIKEFSDLIKPVTPIEKKEKVDEKPRESFKTILERKKKEEEKEGRFEVEV